MQELQHLQVIFEDNHLIAVNKPAGWLVQGDITGDETLLDLVKLYIKKRYNKPGEVFLGLVHRLDRPVTGVIIFARTSKALTRMNKLFQERKVEKTYWAVTKERPRPDEGELTHFLLKDHSRNKTRAFDKKGKKTQDAKKSTLHYQLIAAIDGHFLVEVHPQTGRSHQIRTQLSVMGWPIVGDVKYGFHKANEDGSIHLHSRQLGFIHPVKKEPVLISADPPLNQIWSKFEELF